MARSVQVISTRVAGALLLLNSPAEGARVVRFGIVGVAATATYILVTMIAIEFFKLSPVAASVVGAAGSIGVSYSGHALYSFKLRPDAANFIRFLTLATLSLALSASLMWLTSDVFQMPHMLAVLIVASVVVLINYLCNRFWVFGRDHKIPQPGCDQNSL